MPLVSLTMHVGIRGLTEKHPYVRSVIIVVNLKIEDFIFYFFFMYLFLFFPMNYPLSKLVMCFFPYSPCT